MHYRLGIIGCGNMGSAIVRGGINAGALTASEIIVAEVDEGRRNAMQDLGVVTISTVSDLPDAEQFMLAVKPQTFATVARDLEPRCTANTIIISIMAGLNSRVIRGSLGGRPRIVRAMPNLPCQIGLGMTAVSLGQGAVAGDESLATTLFNAIGRSVMVDESLMHAVTAVSGSGPAYMFLLAEAMEAASTQLGIDAASARLLVTQTLHGSAALLHQSTMSATTWRESVTSRGGTTAAALDVFRQREFTQIIIDALTAACARSRELDQTR